MSMISLLLVKEYKYSRKVMSTNSFQYKQSGLIVQRTLDLSYSLVLNISVWAWCDGLKDSVIAFLPCTFEYERGIIFKCPNQILLACFQDDTIVCP